MPTFIKRKAKPQFPRVSSILSDSNNDLDKVSRDLSLLHPTVRNSISEVCRYLEIENLPLRIFEAYRSPERQNYLYNKGRSLPGNVVTNSRGWESYHQYGLAVDFALFIEGNWSWDDKGEKEEWWNTLHDIAASYGLEPIPSEKPHLQLASLKLDSLRHGSLPGGGDPSWWENIKQAAKGYLPIPGFPPGPALA